MTGRKKDMVFIIPPLCQVQPEGESAHSPAAAAFVGLSTSEMLNSSELSSSLFMKLTSLFPALGDLATASPSFQASAQTAPPGTLYPAALS